MAHRQAASFTATAVLALATLTSTSLVAQTIALTDADYARAESRMGQKTSPLVDHMPDHVAWLKEPGEAKANRFWFRDTANGVTTFMLIDAPKGTKVPAFDHALMATALVAAGVRGARPQALPITDLSFADADKTAVVSVQADRYRCAMAAAYSCVKEEKVQARQQAADGQAGMTQNAAAAAPTRPGRDVAVVSPDGKKAVLIHDWNLWVRDIATGLEKPLTTDGVKDYGYATDNAGWTHSDRAVVVWSPDSKMIATFQQDQRKSGDMYLVTTSVGHPHLEQWKYPLPGDKDVTMIERVVLDADSGKTVRFKTPPSQHRSTLCDDISCRGGGWDDTQWSADSKTIAFVDTSRDHRVEDLRLADVATGDVRQVFNETVATQFQSGMGRVNWRYLSRRNEFVWFSERSNWGHLYLYDMATGKLKNAVTSGDWNVTQLLRVDEKTGEIVFEGVGLEKGWDPYYSAAYRGNLDGKAVTLLTPENANHAATLSEDGNWFVDVYSTPQTPPVAVAREVHGTRKVDVTKTDISRLVATGWKAPEGFTVKARDGKTDLYGLMFKPSNFDATRKYPIVNYIYPGPQVGSVGSRNFSAARGDNQALAELGFIVVAIDGTGTPYRSKAFADAYFGNMGDNTLPDQIAGMKELAAKYAWIDLNRAGIWGHSGGGFATGDAMLRYPDFFKVGWSESGNHDNRNYEDDWEERYTGLLDAKNKAAYETGANQSMAANLKGKLMLVHGTMDDNVPPSNTLLMVDALMRAGKDFDLLMIPNARHGYGDQTLYIARRRWDYFAENLLGATHPHEYKLTMPAARLSAQARRCLYCLCASVCSGVPLTRRLSHWCITFAPTVA